MKIGSVLWGGAVSIVLVLPVLAEEKSAQEAIRAVIDQDGKQRVEILGGSYFFKPDHIIVKANVPVELVVKRESGIVPHTFVLKIPESEIMIDESLSTEAKTIAFTPAAVGKYTFYCRNKLLFFKSHEQKGMKGVLEVVP
ncbi:MAG: cupredoxin domain-containing protein [Gammaproteobacteria bacterium]|nr:cupredoxin domain-containing protein [Gammaproteobacteria bacterium]